jgi:hypothetical protein
VVAAGPSTPVPSRRVQVDPRHWFLVGSARACIDNLGSRTPPCLVTGDPASSRRYRYGHGFQGGPDANWGFASKLVARQPGDLAFAQDHRRRRPAIGILQRAAVIGGMGPGPNEHAIFPYSSARINECSPVAGAKWKIRDRFGCYLRLPGHPVDCSRLCVLRVTPLMNRV